MFRKFLFSFSLCALILAQKSQSKSGSLPRVDISVKTSVPKLKNPNSHIFVTKKHKHENRIDYKNLKQDNASQQPVLFEHVTEIHLTRSKYIITSFLKFDEYYNGFNRLEKFAKRLLTEISKLSQTEMPYFIRRYREKEDTLRSIFETHKQEATHLIEMIDAQKLTFNKILDHLSSDTTPAQKPR